MFPYLTREDTQVELMQAVIDDFLASHDSDTHSYKLFEFLSDLVLRLLIVAVIKIPLETIKQKPDDYNIFRDWLQQVIETVISFKQMAKWSMPKLLRLIIFGRSGDASAVQAQLSKELKEKFLTPFAAALQQGDGLLADLRDREIAITGNTIGLLFAGVDSTAGTLAFIMNYLLANPGDLRNLQTKVDQCFEGGELDVRALEGIHELTHLVYEVQRLHPAFPVLGRQVTQGHNFHFGSVSPGDLLYISQLAMNSDQANWGEDAGSFKPSRFAALKSTDFIRKGFYPFGAGANDCVAKHFAIEAIRLTIAHLLHQFDFKVVSGSIRIESTLDRGGATKPKYPTTIKLIRRNSEFDSATTMTTSTMRAAGS